VFPSVANFVLVRFPRDAGKDATAANAHLLKHGIIPRMMGAYGLGDCLRITIGTEAEMRATRDAIASFLKG
jgi:histidinol-phosphate aminotransferase